MTEKLKKCPFCGGEARTAWQETLDLWYVLCKRCGVTTDFKRERAEAIEAWNRRAV